MKLTIVTPIHRIEYLEAISKTIPEEVQWVCVYDNVIPSFLNDKALCLYMPVVKSSWGVAKINFALDFIKDGHVYILDDDTIVHPDFKVLLSLNDTFDFIHFNQKWKDGRKRTGGVVLPYKIDIGNFIVSRKLIGNTLLEDGRTPDGVWAKRLYNKSKNSIYINRTLSIYNYLR